MRLVGALIAGAFLAGPLAAQDASITDYNPKQITTGTMVTITGDFAEPTEGKLPKPKVFGTSEDSKSKIILKVISNSDTEIVAEVKKIPTNKKNPAAGTDWTLNVQPKGKGAFGAVLQAVDKRTGQVCAVKRMQMTTGESVDDIVVLDGHLVDPPTAPSLATRLEAERCLPKDEAVRVLHDLASTLSRTHAAGLVDGALDSSRVWCEGAGARGFHFGRKGLGSRHLAAACRL